MLNPSSTYEFNLRRNIGHGVHINLLLEVADKNPKHQVDYVIATESWGDVRGKIETVDNIEDEGFYQGYSPSHMQFEFSHKLEYMVEEMRDGSNETIIYKKKKRDLDYEKETREERIFREEFHPDRNQQFNVDFDDIIK